MKSMKVTFLPIMKVKRNIRYSGKFDLFDKEDVDVGNVDVTFWRVW